jgi:cytochrome c biogenesis protein CcmG/thiol:disulfide interchange protein DsbE
VQLAGLLLRLALGVALGVGGMVTRPGDAAAAARTGARAPDFTLPDLDGRPVALAALRGRVVVVEFWASWCAPCGMMLPALDALARRYPASEVTVLAVSVDQSRAAAEALLANRIGDPALTVLHDRSSEVLAEYGADGIPATYVIDAAGTIRLVEDGASAEGLADVARTIERLRTPAADEPDDAIGSRI